MGELRVRSQLVGLAGTLTLCTSALAQNIQGSSAYAWSIPAEPLADALSDLARQSGLQVLFSSQLVAGYHSPELKGSISVVDALGRLMSNTDLGFEFVNPRTIAIVRRDGSGQSPGGSGATTGASSGASSGAASDATPEAPVPGSMAGSRPGGRAAGGGALDALVVSATPLEGAGFDSPMPTQVVSADNLAELARPNVFDSIALLPALLGTSGTTHETGAISAGLQGISAFALRGFSPLRTLTLYDGERVVGANYSGAVDVSLLPQILIERVDVVTGGGSASWGSDAIAGVVNLVTDKKFEGFKSDVSRGVSTYGDNGTTNFKLAAGTGFAADQGHMEVAAEYTNSAGVNASNPLTNFGTGEPNGRNWNIDAGIQTHTIAGTAPGTPQYVYGNPSQSYTTALGGIITAGPLQGTGFGAGGSPYPFRYDVSDVYQAGTLVASLERNVVFARLSYEFDPGVQVFGTFSHGSSITNSQPATGISRNANLTIQCGTTNPAANPYVPASINATCTANDVSSFQYGVSIPFPGWVSVNDRRELRRFVLGAEGSFNALGHGWSWDAYGEYGDTASMLHVGGETLTARDLAAIQAINGPNGTIVCAQAAARANGCVPWDVIGLQPLSPAVLNYVSPNDQPYDFIFERQQAWRVSLNGKPFADWAGEVSLAAGLEYRREDYHSLADPYGNGVTAQDPATGAYPLDPLLNGPVGNNWAAGNYHEGRGRYDVKEAFLETGMPWFKSAALGNADLDLACRHEDYSTAGGATAWKAGLVWDAPVHGIRIRALETEDLRAPNLSEAMAPVNVLSATVNDPFLTGNPSVPINQVNQSNSNLRPEAGRSLNIGVVLQPEYLPGFSASVDYYRIDLHDQIGALSVQQVVNLCYQGYSSYCGQNVIATMDGVPVQDGGSISSVTSRQFNLADTLTTGLDIESSYRIDLARWTVPGSLAVRALATRVYQFTSDSGIPGQPAINYAGALGNYSVSTNYNATGGTIPTWKFLLSEKFTDYRFGFELIQRGFSAGTIENNFIVCQAPNCPIPTAANPTINYNHMAGAIYWDLGLDFQITDRATLYGRVNDLFNPAPPPAPTVGLQGGGVNNTLYDVVGRMFYFGFRTQF